MLMPLIQFLKNRKPLKAKKKQNLMKALLQANIPVASSCGGEAVCGKCRVQVIAGAENLSSENTAEKLVREKYQIPNDFRLSCQCLVQDDITIDTAYW